MATTTVVGGTGNDTITGGAAAVNTVVGGTGNDTVAGGAAAANTGTGGTAAANPYAFKITDPASYTPTTAVGKDWTVDTNQKVQDQLKTIVGADSPLMQQAKTQAMQQMNARGLLSSSMAIGAGQEAVIKQALPIAQADAGTYAAAAKQNAEAANALATFNANLKAKADEFGAAAKNTAALANMDSATKLELQTIDANTRKELVKLEGDYKNQMQATASAGEMFQQATKNINDIMVNPDIYAFPTKDGAPPAANKSNWPSNAAELRNGRLYDAQGRELLSPKQVAVNTQKGYLENSLQIVGVTSTIPGLKDLITFEETPTTKPNPNVVSTPWGDVSKGTARAFGDQLGNALASGALAPIAGTETARTPVKKSEEPKSGGTSGGKSGGTSGGKSGNTSGGKSGGTSGGGTSGGKSGGTSGGKSGGTSGGTSGGKSGGTSSGGGKKN
jgi:hypothetical protein